MKCQIALLLCIATCQCGDYSAESQSVADSINPPTLTRDMGSDINALVTSPLDADLDISTPDRWADCVFPLPFDKVVSEIDFSERPKSYISVSHLEVTVGSEEVLKVSSLHFCVAAIMFGCQVDGTIVRGVADIEDSLEYFYRAGQGIRDNGVETFWVYFITGAPIIKNRKGSNMEIVMEKLPLDNYNIIGLEQAHVIAPDQHDLDVYVTAREIFFVRSPDPDSW